MKCYFDGSLTFGDGDQWMTLAALVASDDVWAAFEKEWDKMLAARYPVAPFIHMTDLISRSDPFEQIVGWDEDKRRQLVYDAGEVLRSFKGDRLCATYCTINVSARNRIAAEGVSIGEPSAICAENCFMHAWTWHQERHGMELAYLFFDQNEPYRSAFFSRWQELERQPIKHGIWGWISSMPEVNMRHTPGIQAADVVAWAISRRHRNAPGDVWATLAEQLVWTRDRKDGKPKAGMLSTVGLELNERLLRKHQKKFDPLNRNLGPR